MAAENPDEVNLLFVGCEDENVVPSPTEMVRVAFLHHFSEQISDRNRIVINGISYRLHFKHEHSEISQLVLSKADAIMCCIRMDDVSASLQNRIKRCIDQSMQNYLPLNYLITLNSIKSRKCISMYELDECISKYNFDGYFPLNAQSQSIESMFDAIHSDINSFESDIIPFQSWNAAPNNNDTTTTTIRWQLCTRLHNTVTVTCALLSTICNVIVIHHFRATDKREFYLLSLTLFILAHVLYSIILMWEYSPVINRRSLLLLLLCFIPMSPFMPHFLHYTATTKHCESILQKLNLRTRPQHRDITAPIIRQWVEQQYHSQYGYILQLVIEGIPQSMIGMVALCYYHDHSYFIVGSVVVTLVSIAMKSVIFSESINAKTILFNWFSFVNDAIGCFLTIAIVVYNPHRSQSLTTIGRLWLWKYLCITVPIVLICGMAKVVSGGLQIYACVHRWLGDQNWRIWQRCLSATIVSIVLSLFWLIGTVIGSIFFEIACFSYFARLMIVYNTIRFIGYTGNSAMHCDDFWQKIFTFVSDAHNKRDRIIRLCAINRILSQSIISYDTIMTQFLNRDEFTQFSNVAMTDFRIHNCNDANATFCGAIIDWWVYNIESDSTLSEQIFGVPVDIYHNTTVSKLWYFVAIYIVFPLYIALRLLHLTLPIIVLCVSGYATIRDTPQWYLMCIYGAAVVVWFALAIVVFWEQYISYHIARGYKFFAYHQLLGGSDRFFKRLLQLIVAYYDRLVVAPVRKQLLLDFFPVDIGCAISEYLLPSRKTIQVTTVPIHSNATGVATTAGDETERLLTL